MTTAESPRSGKELLDASRLHARALEAAGDFDDPDDRLVFDRLYPAPKRETLGAENR